MLIEEKLVEILKKEKMYISFAESCTGGLCAARIINVSGASDILSASFVTYSAKAKIEFVECQKTTINTYGVVSKEVAEEMAIGAAKKAQSEIGVGITGVAGPTGGSALVPVGTVCFGIFNNGKVFSFCEHFSGDRLAVRNKSVDFIFNKLIEILQQKSL